jgi:hypothetical protein
MKYIFLTAFLSINSFAHDHHRPWWLYSYNLREYARVCIRERWIPVNVRTTESACFVSKDLKLKEGKFHYPNIHSGLMTVRYWEGQVAKTVTTGGDFKHIFTNICEGGVTYSEIEPRTIVRKVTTDLENPNLDFTIAESYNLVPMTKAEALEAWNDLKAQCGL